MALSSAPMNGCVPSLPAISPSRRWNRVAKAGPVLVRLKGRTRRVGPA